MTPLIQKHLRQPPSPEPLRLTHAHAAAIDVHAAVHWVAVPPGDAPPPADHPANLPRSSGGRSWGWRRWGRCRSSGAAAPGKHRKDVVSLSTRQKLAQR
jgi:hypothetical protein